MGLGVFGRLGLQLQVAASHVVRDSFRVSVSNVVASYYEIVAHSTYDIFSSYYS